MHDNRVSACLTNGDTFQNPLSLTYGVTLKIDEKLCNIIVKDDEHDGANFKILSDLHCR